MDTKIINIFVASNPNFENKGDASILFATVNAFKKIHPACHISLYSPRAKYDSQWDAGFDEVIDAYKNKNKWGKYAWRLVLSKLPVALFDLTLRWVTRNTFPLLMHKDVWNAFRLADLVLVGLNGTYTSMFSSHKNILAMIGDSGVIGNSYWIWASRLFGKSVALFGASTEPSPWKLQRKVTSHALNQASVLTVREPYSVEYMKSIGVTKDIYLCADLAFLTPTLQLPNDFSEKVTEFQGSNLLIGFSISSRVARLWFPNNPDGFENMVEAFCKICTALHKKLNAKILFVPHSVGPSTGSDDRIAATRIFEVLNSPEWIWNIRDDLDPRIARGLIGKCDVFLGCRTHSVIHALSQKVPSIVMNSTPNRARGIIGSLLGNETWVYAEQYNNEKLMNLIFKLIEERNIYFSPTYENELNTMKKAALKAALLASQTISSEKIND